MKGIKFLSALALVMGLGLTACDNFDLPNPPGQTYPQPDGFLTDSDLKLGAIETPLNLAQANAANEDVTVATIEELNNFPSEYTLNLYMEVAGDAAYSKVSTIATTIADNNVIVAPDVLNGAIQEVITKKPGEYDVYARFVAYATLGTTNLRIGGIDATYGEEILKVRTMDATKVIEDAYYLVPCDAAGKAQLSKAVKMNNTAGNVSGYDNPEFAVKLDVAEGVDYLWKIAPQSAITANAADELFGCNPETDGMSGKLATSYEAGVMPIAGSVLLTVNMEADSYTVSYAFDNIYPVSGTTQPKNAMALYTDNYINYYGVTALNRQWTIYTQVDKSGVVFGNDDEVEPEVSENGFEQTGAILAGSTSKLTTPVQANSLYYVDINLVQATYDLKALTTLGIVGNHNGWNEKESIALTASRDLKTWTATDVELDGEFKINANSAWDYDFGGTAVETTNGEFVFNLSFKGGNMNIEKGKYDVKVDFSTLPYVLTLTKK